MASMLQELERKLHHPAPARPVHPRPWWADMNLDRWAHDGPQLASVAADMPFAQAIAAHRADRRGVRQRIAVRRNAGGSMCLFVEDASEPVAEPCS